MKNRVFLYTDNSLNSWQGYVFYINNIINALLEASKTSGKSIKITLICSKIDYENHYSRTTARNIQILDLDKLLVNKILRILHRIGVLNRLKFITLYKCSIFPIIKSNFKRKFIIFNWTKIIYWIPDFQHVFLPHYFSLAEITERDGNIRNMLNDKYTIVLSSLSSFNDMKDYYKSFKHDRIKILNFRVYADLIYEKNIDKQLPKKYFLISNQFWLHKNHKLILESLNGGLLNKDVVFVITGKTKDYRDIDGEINKLVENFLKQENVILTGYIDDYKLFNLIKNAHAVIQPSLFEGWNTVIEYSQLFNKLVIASNLDVHYEQLANEGFYFESSDVIDFSIKLNEVWDLKLEDWKYEMNYKEKQCIYSTELFKIIF